MNKEKTESLPKCFACPIHLQMENLHLQREVERLKTELSAARETDVMTGLANKKRFAREIDHHVAIFRRNKMNFSVVFIDIDNFKKHNDKSHLLGDRLIIEFADFLAVSVRACDIVARFGGDEFCILVPDATQEEATEMCNNITERLATYFFNEVADPVHLSASWGVASTSEGFLNREDLLTTSNTRLIEAKARKKVK